MDGDPRRGRLDGGALTGKLVCANTINLLGGKRWGQLIECSAKIFECCFDCLCRYSRRRRRHSFSSGCIVGLGGQTEAYSRDVFLVTTAQKGCQSRRTPNDQGKDASGQRIERTGMTDPPRAERPAHAVDDIMRSRSRWFVDDENAIHGSYQLPASSFQQLSFFRASGVRRKSWQLVARSWKLTTAYSSVHAQSRRRAAE